MRWLALLLLLAGCVPADQVPMKVDAGKYGDYRALIADLVSKRVEGQAAPAGLEGRLEKCWADDTISMIEPDELQTLDTFARGQRPLADSELSRINDKIEARRVAQGRDQPGFDRVVATCPSDIPAFKKYFKLD